MTLKELGNWHTNVKTQVVVKGKCGEDGREIN
jgi:hypothetical protein